MNQRRLLIVLVVAAFVIPALVVTAYAATSTQPGHPVMAGLGDSWTYGEGATDPATTGYLAATHEALKTELDCLPAASTKARDGCKHLQLDNIARPGGEGLPGVTTDAVIDEQLPVMIPMIEERNGDANPRNDVEVIYLSVGGNDVSGPVIEACLYGTPEQCEATIGERLAHVAANLHTILGSLRDAAGPDTPIVVVTYDSPVPFCELGAMPGAAELGALLLGQLDQVTRSVAANHGASVATTFGRLGEGDWVGGSDCLHPNDSGYQKVAEIAIAAGAS